MGAHRHDAYLAFSGLDDAWAVGTNEPRLRVLQDALHLYLQHATCREQLLSERYSALTVIYAMYLPSTVPSVMHCTDL